jgi:competence protein ComGC
MNKTSEQKKKELIWIGILFIVAIISVLIAILIPAKSRVKKIAPSIVCASNLKGLGFAFTVYADDHNGSLPGKNWCDLSMEEMDIGPRTFNCRAEECVIGESSYAMNINAVGKKLSELPPDMVLMFETNLGKGTGQRQPIKTCRSFDKYKIMASCFTGDEEVYPDKWNQVGGAETLTIEHHKKKGCNILFVSGHVEFIKAEEIKNLKWKPEE